MIEEWPEDERNNSELDTLPDQPTRTHDGRWFNPRWVMVFGIGRYNREIQFAPVADMGLLTQEF